MFPPNFQHPVAPRDAALCVASIDVDRHQHQGSRLVEQPLAKAGFSAHIIWHGKRTHLIIVCFNNRYGRRYISSMAGR